MGVLTIQSDIPGPIEFHGPAMAREEIFADGVVPWRNHQRDTALHRQGRGGAERLRLVLVGTAFGSEPFDGDVERPRLRTNVLGLTAEEPREQTSEPDDGEDREERGIRWDFAIHRRD